MSCTILRSGLVNSGDIGASSEFSNLTRTRKMSWSEFYFSHSAWSFLAALWQMRGKCLAAEVRKPWNFGAFPAFQVKLAQDERRLLIDSV